MFNQIGGQKHLFLYASFQLKVHLFSKHDTCNILKSKTKPRKNKQTNKKLILQFKKRKVYCYCRIIGKRQVCQRR